MVETQFNIFDAIVIGIVALSTLIAFFRGLVREVLSLAAWLGAGLATLYLFPYAVEFLKSHVQSHNDTILAGVAGVGTYITSLIVISIFIRIIMRYVKTSSEVGILDNLLGLLFGFARGMFTVSLAYLMMQVILPQDKDHYPEWLRGSKTEPYTERGALFLREAAPKYIAEMQKDSVAMRDRATKERENMKNELRNEAKDAQDGIHAAQSDYIRVPPATLEPIRESKP